MPRFPAATTSPAASTATARADLHADPGLTLCVHPRPHVGVKRGNGHDHGHDREEAPAKLQTHRASHVVLLRPIGRSRTIAHPPRSRDLPTSHCDATPSPLQCSRSSTLRSRHDRHPLCRNVRSWRTIESTTIGPEREHDRTNCAPIRSSVKVGSLHDFEVSRPPASVEGDPLRSRGRPRGRERGQSFT